MKGTLKAGLLIAIIALITTTLIYAENEKFVWESIYKGVKYLFYEADVNKKTVRFYAVSIDLNCSGIKIITSPQQNKSIKISQFAKKIGAQIAINGGFCNIINHKPIGLNVFEGEKYKDSIEDESYGFFAVTKRGKPWIASSENGLNFSSDRTYMAVSGFPMIVENGRISEKSWSGYINLKHPRSAIGIDKTGKKLFFVVSDGRQKDSASIGLRSLAEFMIKIGVWNALNIDGGGSSILYIEKKGGIVNNPSDGKERHVLNSVMVIIK